MNRTQEIMEITDRYSIRNYNRYPVAIIEGRGAWVWDAEGRGYIDMLSGYGVVNDGHSNKRVINAIIEQAKRLMLISGNYYNDQHAKALEVIAKFFGKNRILFSSGGAESVEAAIKISRKWGYDRKKITGLPEIIACKNNFHGRSMGALALSDYEPYRKGFGPFMPGLTKKIKFGDSNELRQAITKNTVAFFVEPLQGEGGMHVPPDGYLKEVEKICRKNNVLLVLDEIQTGFGRTGDDFAYQREFVDPDILIIGKALGGGIAVSAILGNDHIMDVIGYGDHGSTFGGNPLACAMVVEAFEILKDENISKRSKELGVYFMSRLKEIKSGLIKEVRGRGLFIGVQLPLEIDIHGFCTKLLEHGVMTTSARGNVLRLTPPLVIRKEEIDWAMERIEQVFRQWR